MPTLKVFVGGEVVRTIVGARPRPVRETDLAEFLK